jgi:hypothetical protein
MVSRNERDLIEAIAEDDEDLIEAVVRDHRAAGAASSVGSAFTQVMPTNKAPSVARVANAFSTADARIDQVARRNRIQTSNLESQIEDLRRNLVLSTVLSQPDKREITKDAGELQAGDKLLLGSDSTLSAILPALLIMGGSESRGSNRNGMTSDPLMMVLMIQAINGSNGGGTSTTSELMPLLLIMMMR